MPLYNYQCEHCEGIFEAMRSISSRNDEQVCPYCDAKTEQSPMITGGHSIESKAAWKPQSTIETLTGQDVTGPGVNPNAKRTSILHACKGYNCSLCP